MGRQLLRTALLFIVITMVACGDDEQQPIEKAAYDPTPFELTIPSNFPQPVIPDSNPLTVKGVDLGRRLFYDPIVSSDSTMACASCHKQELGFSASEQFSEGVLGMEGNRHSMPLFNLAFGLNTRFTWDGRAETLEDQMIEPIENMVELNLPINELVNRLTNNADYCDRFSAAFDAAPSEELIGKALAQFVRTIISADSKYDKVLRNEPIIFSEQELAGFDLFTLETGTDIDTECIHCHGGILFTENTFKNNGLDASPDLMGFPDLGFGLTTGIPSDNGKFKAPTLRNVMLTAPYMHDGRFATMDEVLDHYSNGIKNSPTLDVLIESEFTTNNNLDFSEEAKADLQAFLHTLTDSTFLNNPDYSSPFE